MTNQSLIVQVLRQPHIIAEFNHQQWYQLVAVARRLKLLAYLGLHFQRHQLTEQIPTKVAIHIDSAVTMTQSIHRACMWELTCLSKELAHVDLTVLKGAAYCAKALPHSHYRHTSDVDILVAKERLKDVEMRLKLQGWQASVLDEYDDNYYRHWAHEIPPMYHPKRGTTLDIHHNLFPVISKRVKINIAAIVANKQPLFAQIHTLSDVDMVLHSAIHLFMQEDFSRGLRDLIDMKEMLEYFSARDSRFVETLVARQSELQLSPLLTILFYQLEHVFGYKVPNNINRKCSLTSWLIKESVLSNSHFSTSIWAKFTSKALFVRGHMLKMPIRVLLYHTLNKVRRRWQSKG